MIERWGDEQIVAQQEAHVSGAAERAGALRGGAAGPLARSLAMAAAAFCLYGGWAMLANRGHGLAAARRAGLVQGVLSFTITLGMTMLIEALHRRLRDRRRGAALTALCAVGLSGSAVVLGHLAAGTPEVLRTVAPSLLIGSFYATSYTLALRRL